MARPKKVAVPDAVAVMDFGGLSTRVFYLGSHKSQTNSFIMESQVGPVSRDTANAYTLPNLTSTSPENIAWVAINNDCRAVGYLAASQFNAHIGLNGLKYSSALYKALAALWVISRKLDLGHHFSIAIAVFLPPGEFNDSKQFFELLSRAAASFETPTGRFSVKLDKTQALQEGGGISIVHNSKLGAAFKTRVTAFAMVGFRNASLVVAARGAVGKGKTSDLGMVRMVELVQERTSNYDLARLAEAIAISGDRYNRPYFYRIARNREEAAREREVDELIAAVKQSRSDYARMLTHWLDEVLPPDTDEIVFCGGTAEYLKPELRSHYSRYAQSWHAGIVVPPELDPNGLGHRLADAYGLFIYFKSQFEGLRHKSIQATEVESTEESAEPSNEPTESSSELAAESSTKTTDIETPPVAAVSAKDTGELDAVSLLSGPYRGGGKKKENSESCLNGKISHE
ncbi:MAG TPA: ParM/StbA family protein [Leptolyngbyaceae cyanobacterium]